MSNVSETIDSAINVGNFRLSAMRQAAELEVMGADLHMRLQQNAMDLALKNRELVTLDLNNINLATAMNNLSVSLRYAAKEKKNAAKKLEIVTRTAYNAEMVLSAEGIPNWRMIQPAWAAYSKICRRSRICLLYTSPSPRDRTRSRMPSSA